MKQLISIIEAGLFEFLLEFGSIDTGSIYYSDNYKYVISEIPKFCNIFGSNFTQKEILNEIERIKNLYFDKKLSFFWITGPSTIPFNTKDFLLKNGFKYTGSSNGKIYDLGDYKEKSLSGSELTIKKINNTDDLIVWLEIVKFIFNFINNQSEILFNIMKNKIFIEQKFDLYIGYRKSTPVCSGAIYKEKNSAVVYWIATVPEMRRNSLATDMMLHILNETKKSGYKYITLQSSSMAYELYRKLNFTHYCDFEFYSATP